ncbi:hypothetical protein M7I_3081 [Glarea lozoyensis 74030]|uniref:Uncharacterized protein n=1 Tax=Glarea lozoyensis (strain ATCC 74030 / MF5533) TaxID=1104152 RepID=H0EKI3_GLAL7|nr:hypothetical protein M7I_3081 [Glarea lozoyensis 74030]
MASRSKTKTTRPVLIIAIDPGTSTLSARYAIAYDSFNDQGQLEREVIQESLVDNWPSSSSPGAIYLPTTLVFSKVSKELLHWGFAAQTYLEEEETVMNRLEEVVIENVKIVLQQPEDATELDRVSSLPRHRETRNLITQVLGKTPDDIFEEFLTVTLSHIFERAILEHAARSFFSQSIHVEFVICFPGGWSGALHTRVAKLAANAMQKSMEKCQVRVDNFGLQDVYTVSETLSGIREWLYKLFPKMTETYAPEVTVTAFNAKAICVSHCASY